MRRSVFLRAGNPGAPLLALLVAACSANSGYQTGSSTASNAVTTKAASPIISMIISPASVSTGQSATATWNTSGATSCQADGAWSGSLPLSDTVGKVIGPFISAGTFTYTVSCTGAGGTGSGSQSITVGAVPVPTIDFGMTPDAVAPGGTAVLTWSTTNATSCTGSSGTGADGWQGSQATQDLAGFSVGPIASPGQFAYDLTCLGPGGSTQATRILTVTAASPVAPPSLSFTAQSTDIQPSQSVALSWTATDATACAASGGSGADTWSGAQLLTESGFSTGPISTPGTYSYTLTCTGAGGSVAKSLSILVTSSSTPPAVGVSISISPTTIGAGGSSNLTWSAANSTTCTASGSWSGNQPLLGSAVSTGTLDTAAVYSYTLTCAGPGGSASNTAFLTVTPAPATLTRFSAAPASIQTGQPTTLSWASAGATSCTGSGGTGSDGWIGVQAAANAGVVLPPITLAGTYIYTLICIGPGGLGLPLSVSVTVSDAVPPLPSVVSFSASPSIVAFGQAAVLTWSTNGATSCLASGGSGSDGWPGSVGITNSGRSTGALTAAGSVTYTLVCSGPGGMSAASSVVVNVNSAQPTAANITSFSVTPATIQTGQAATLAWSTSGATACTASGGTGTDGWAGPQPALSLATSTGLIATATSFVYTLTCSGPGGVSAAKSVVLNVSAAPPPPAAVTAFTALPTLLLTGQSTTLLWSSTSATSCTAGGGTGSDGWAGTVLSTHGSLTAGPLAAAGNFVYTLTCSGSGGTSATSSITVDVDSLPPLPSIDSFLASPGSIELGQSITLTWATSYATSCTPTGGTGSDGWLIPLSTLNAGLTIGPITTTGTITYTLTCTGAGGTSSPSSVSVNVTIAPPPPSIALLTAVPNALQIGQATLLTWTAVNATSCVASGGTGSDGWSGVMPTVSLGRSSGLITAAGTYTYTLTCSGPGGVNASSSAIVTVTTAPPQPTIGTFTATPATLQIGHTLTLAWSTNAATACTATGGTGTDSWAGLIAVASAGTVIGPINAAGTYVYTLTCVGLGGISVPTSLTVIVNSAPPVPAIVSFTATPTTLQAGQSISLAWTTTGTTSCTASGGSGSDGWSGTVAAQGSGTSIGPLSAARLTYTLACTGPGGSSTPNSVAVTVTAALPAQPTVVLVANGVSAAQIQPGGSATLSWSTSNATSCSASGGAGSDGWTGTKTTASAGVSVGPIATPGIYAYTLTCTGPGGSGSSTAQVTVIASASFDCGVPGIPTTALVAPASVATTITGLCLLDCSITNANNVIDSTPSSYATMSIPLGVAGIETLAVDGTTTFPAGRKAGFVLANGAAILNLSLLQGISVETLKSGSVQEMAGVGSLLTLQAAGALSVDQYAGYAEFTTTKSFDSVKLVAGSLASLASTIKVYGACVSLQ